MKLNTLGDSSKVFFLSSKASSQFLIHLTKLKKRHNRLKLNDPTELIQSRNPP